MKRIITFIIVINLFFFVDIDARDIENDFPSLFFSDEVDDGYNNNNLDNVVAAVDKARGNVCDTSECRQIADEFISSMNKTVNPCDDFYEFVCGSWAEKKPIPKYLPGWNRIMMFQFAVKYRIKEVLKTLPAPEDILPVRQAKKWFRSCMDQETHNSRGINPIESILMQIGGWPMAMDKDEWDDDNYAWQKVDEYYVKLTGKNTFYNMKLTPSNDNKVGSIIIKGLDMPLNDLLPTDSRNYSGEQYHTYKAFLKNTTRLFITNNRADVSDDQLERDINDLINFEEQLYKLVRTRRYQSERMNIVNLTEWYNNSTYPDENKKYRIDWKKSMQNVFDFGSLKVDDSLSVEIRGLKYFEDLPKLLANTSSRTIVNYIHWNFVTLSLRFTMDKFRDLFFEYLKDEYGVEERPPRWLECVEEVDMKHATAYAFVEKYFPASTKTMADEMGENIRSQVKEAIEVSDWMNDTAKEILKEKLKALEFIIGFPDWYKNRTIVVNYYKGLTIGHGYLDNGLSFLRYKRKLEVEAYEKSNGEFQWLQDPVTVNAAYYVGRNILSIPAADFQSPLFAPGMPDFVNYGITGVIIGHEVSHAFDVTGIRMGVGGTKSKLDRDTVKNFYNQAKCFATQFDKYYFHYDNGTRIDITKENFMQFYSFMGMTRGQSTAGENIADTTSLDAVFKAYKNLLKNKEPNYEKKLPGLENYTDEQLFFISFAGTWCEVGTDKFYEKRNKSFDVHSPPKLRVRGAVSNSYEFSRVFNCPIDSRMNPEFKCNIWKKSSNVIQSLLESNEYSLEHQYNISFPPIK